MIGLLGLPDAHLAEIEQRNLELDFEAALAHWLAVSSAAASLMTPDDLQQIDEARRIRQPVGLRQRIDLDPRDLQIDAAADRFRLDRRQRPRRGWAAAGSALGSLKSRSSPHSPSARISRSRSLSARWRAVPSCAVISA